MLPLCSNEQRNSTSDIIHFTEVHQSRNTIKGGAMRNLLKICCGLDAREEVLAACMLKGGIDEEQEPVFKEFPTLLYGLDEFKKCAIV